MPKRPKKRRLTRVIRTRKRPHQKKRSRGPKNNVRTLDGAAATLGGLLGF